MPTINFNLRGISHKVMTQLKHEAIKQETSVNTIIIKIIERGLGYSHEIKKMTYHDLDKLAGTWSEKDAREIRNNLKDFEKIDKDLWG